ncbi:Rrf2 family transcriptional regulator [Basilea psittacipulmonis]|uniref:DNA-binding protein n=1 Tax=Basilea psittacipulmonis DSM 24701 TaxID=1072685 RepID=A0A077DHS9_9BURK|nr:Rrf2 family transcriptional regulator [Basilea psittacipulmonis]AIL32693.1 DNA-binding protein [Basilea psittacipulmonis DSM 24701]
MRLTTKGRFAVTAMIDIALRQNKGPVRLSSIAERQNISLSYLEQLFGKLKKVKLVDSFRGPGGGYVLARSANSISIAEIILAVDEPIDATSCGNNEPCTTGRNGMEDGRCMTHNLWSRLNRTMLQFLDSVSLQSLVDENRMTMNQQQAIIHPAKFIQNTTGI